MDHSSIPSLSFTAHTWISLPEKEPRWSAETQRYIERIAAEMAACAKMLLCNAKGILFIDPYFNPQAQRFKRSLKAFLQMVADRPAGIPIVRIEIHTGHEAAGTRDFGSVSEVAF
jgi:hypothetical protein